MEKSKKKKKAVKIKISRKSGSSRLIIGGREIFGVNSHGMYESNKTLHIHFGRSKKVVIFPKELRGLWTKKGRKYVRVVPKDTGKERRRKRRRRE